jgi:hypothetical protein
VAVGHDALEVGLPQLVAAAATRRRVTDGDTDDDGDFDFSSSSSSSRPGRTSMPSSCTTSTAGGCGASQNSRDLSTSL